eukprot:1495426-Pyramimonas_sp.AAC.1
MTSKEMDGVVEEGRVVTSGVAKLSTMDGDAVQKAYDTAGFFSHATWVWVDRLVRVGYKRQLQEDDIPGLQEQFQVENELATFERLWAEDVATNEVPSLGRVLKKQFRAGTQLAAPMILRAIIRYTVSRDFSPDPDPKWEGYTLAVAFAVVPFTGAFFFQHSMKGSRCMAQVSYMLGASVRALTSALVYQKVFRLSNSARSQKSIGELQNLMSFDCKQFGDQMMLLPSLFSAPVQIISILILLYVYLGPTMLLGVAIMIFSVPVSGIAFAKVAGHRKKQSVHMDKRLKLLSEMVQGVRVLKFYTWEDYFRTEAEGFRLNELHELRTQNLLRASITFSTVGIPLLVTISSFGLYSALGNNLTTEKAFPALSLFNALVFPLSFLPITIANAITLNVAVKRIDAFFQKPERQAWPPNNPAESGGDAKAAGSTCAIRLKGANFLWAEKEGMVGYAKPEPPPA